MFSHFELRTAEPGRGASCAGKADTVAEGTALKGLCEDAWCLSSSQQVQGCVREGLCNVVDLHVTLQTHTDDGQPDAVTTGADLWTGPTATMEKETAMGFAALCDCCGASGCLRQCDDGCVNASGPVLQGSLVRPSGLQKCQDLNGLQGRVVGPIRDGDRWPVRVVGRDAVVAVKAINLHRCSAADVQDPVTLCDERLQKSRTEYGPGAGLGRGSSEDVAAGLFDYRELERQIDYAQVEANVRREQEARDNCFDKACRWPGYNARCEEILHMLS